MAKSVAVIVDSNFLFPKPRHGLANLFNRFANGRHDYITRFRVAKRVSHLAFNLRERTGREGTVSRVYLTVMNHADAVFHIIGFGKAFAANEFANFTQGFPRDVSIVKTQ